MLGHKIILSKICEEYLMSFFVLIILAVIQGLTEFLPVSSSGHLVVLYNWFGIENNVMLLSILLHIATLISVLIYYRKELIVLIRHPFCPTNRKILVTTIVTCGVVLIMKPLIDSLFDGEYIFVFFLITAILLMFSDYMAERKQKLSRTKNFVSKSLECVDKNCITNIDVNYFQAVLIGVTQGIACIPGISRSGSTIAVSRMCGVTDSTRYSFLISIPIIIASLVLEVAEGGSVGGINIISLIVGMIVCAVVGYFAIKFMTKLVEKNKLIVFSYYLIILSTILVVLSFVR